MTDPNDLIDGYVDDVARRLPGRLRNDVGLELRALLKEELRAKEDAAGRPADSEMALSLLGAFGRPADVADRYRPASFLIIKPSETKSFALSALLSVAAQWALTLPAVFLQPEAFPGQAFTRLARWWLSWGLGAFWLPGLLVVILIVARGVGHYRGSDDRLASRKVDSERVVRPALGLALLAWTVGAAIVIALPWAGARLPGVLPRVFAFDEGFLRTRAVWLLPAWGVDYAVHAAALAQGRWSRLTRRLHVLASVVVCGVLAWFVAAGPIFVARPTDQTARGIIGLTVLVSLFALVPEVYREMVRVRPTGDLAGGPRAWP